jgi:hypothetical protein
MLLALEKQRERLATRREKSGRILTVMWHMTPPGDEGGPRHGGGGAREPPDRT